MKKIKHNNKPNEIIQSLGIIEEKDVFVDSEFLYTKAERAVFFEDVSSSDIVFTEDFLKFISLIPIYKYDSRFKDVVINDEEFNNDYIDIDGFKFLNNIDIKDGVLKALKEFFNGNSTLLEEYIKEHNKTVEMVNNWL